jgi:hypothetical protein
MSHPQWVTNNFWRLINSQNIKIKLFLHLNLINLHSKNSAKYVLAFRLHMNQPICFSLFWSQRFFKLINLQKYHPSAITRHFAHSLWMREALRNSYLYSSCSINCPTFSNSVYRSQSSVIVIDFITGSWKHMAMKKRSKMREVISSFFWKN